MPQIFLNSIASGIVYPQLSNALCLAVFCGDVVPQCLISNFGNSRRKRQIQQCHTVVEALVTQFGYTFRNRD